MKLGLLTSVFQDRSLDEALDLVQSSGLERVERSARVGAPPAGVTCEGAPGTPFRLAQVVERTTMVGPCSETSLALIFTDCIACPVVFIPVNRCRTPH
jgi:hypothetical protein